MKMTIKTRYRNKREKNKQTEIEREKKSRREKKLMIRFLNEQKKEEKVIRGPPIDKTHKKPTQNRIEPNQTSNKYK